MNTKLEMSTKSEFNKNNKINAIRVLIAVSFSAFAADRRCTPFYLDKSRKINPNCPKRNLWTTQSNEMKSMKSKKKWNRVDLLVLWKTIEKI